MRLILAASRSMLWITTVWAGARRSAVQAFVPTSRSWTSRTGGTTTASTAGLRRTRLARTGDSAMAYIERLQREQGILSNFQYGAFDVPPSSALGASVSDESLTSALDHEEDDSRHGPIVFPLQGKVPDEQPPRMRFAPSPTGSLHVGGARTALYNWLVARKGQAEEPQSNAAFVLRVEDTDLARSTKESENSVLADLEWLGLLWDEGPDMPSETAPYGPYRQSERGKVYYAVAQKLMDDGKAYRCFCTPEELDAMKADQEARGETPRYDGRWRDASVDDVQQALDEGKPYTVRFKVTDNSRVVIDDVVRGMVSWDAQATVGDFILLRSSGVPVYNFCVAVDDACMGITTVVRAEEHLTNTVRQALVLDALGAPRPRYAHCSLILGEDKQKLSKRHGATSCDQYRLDGFLPDAMINYLALLGWNDGTDNEIFARDELIDAFELDRVVKSPSVFDLEKLKWVNAQHLKLRTVEDLVPLVKQQILWQGMFKDGLVSDDSVDLGVIDFTYAATALAKQMMETTKDAALNAKTVLGYSLPATFTDVRDEEARTMIATGNFYALAQKLVAQYRSGEFPRPDESNPLAAFQDAEGRMIEEDTQKGPACQFTQDYMAHMKSLAKELGLKGRHLFHPVRLALTGEMSGQDVTKQMSLLALATKADSVIDSQYVVDMETRMTRLEAFCESIPDEYRAPRTVAKKESESVVGPTAAATTATTVESPGTDSSTVDPKDAYTGPPISALDIRVGRVMKVWEHPEADKLYCEEIDVGEDEPRQIASGLRPHLQPEDIDGRLVLVLCNLKERKLVGFASHGMVLCASNADHSEVRLVNPPVDARIGERVSIPDFDFTSEEGAPFAENKVGKKKIVEQLAPYLVTNRYGVPEFLGRPFVTSAGVCTTSIPDGTVS